MKIATQSQEVWVVGECYLKCCFKEYCFVFIVEAAESFWNDAWPHSLDIRSKGSGLCRQFAVQYEQQQFAGHSVCTRRPLLLNDYSAMLWPCCCLKLSHPKLRKSNTTLRVAFDNVFLCFWFWKFDNAVCRNLIGSVKPSDFKANNPAPHRRTYMPCQHVLPFFQVSFAILIYEALNLCHTLSKLSIPNCE